MELYLKICDLIMNKFNQLPYTTSLSFHSTVSPAFTVISPINFTFLPHLTFAPFSTINFFVYERSGTF